MKRRFYVSDVFCALCVAMAVLAAVSGGALGFLIGIVILGTGLLLSVAQRILAGIRQLEGQRVDLPHHVSGGVGGSAAGLRTVNRQGAPALALQPDEHG